ncbi:hypothetical protein FISHEDRAFT_78494 [Fistulina hepatica ATCC 64428]|nr:hypothetical protein FISHEDRAFT_78494 [Fistulina hepatica ATCC 64428]
MFPHISSLWKLDFLTKPKNLSSTSPTSTSENVSSAAENASSLSEQSKARPKRRHRPPWKLGVHAISTMDPSRLSAADLVDLSHKERPMVTTSAHNAAASVWSFTSNAFPVRYYYGYHEDLPRLMRARKWPYPSDTKGFFYYHQPHDPSHAIRSQIRFRLASCPDDFWLGKDLQFPTGLPWRIPLLMIACPRMHPQLQGFYDQLLQESLVSSEITTRCQTITNSTRGKMDIGDNIIYSFREPISLELDAASPLAVWVVGPDIAYRVVVPNPFWDPRPAYNHKLWRSPYIGHVIVYFEPSTLPEHKDTRTLMLRISRASLDSTIPSYDNWVSQPKEGRYLRHGEQMWTWDLDSELGFPYVSDTSPDQKRTTDQNNDNLRKAMEWLWEEYQNSKRGGTIFPPHLM